MSRKRIALLCSQLEERYQSEFIQGFLSKSLENNYDVCVFSPFSKSPASELQGIGDGNIFNLINYDAFDGIVILPDTIRITGMLMKLEKEFLEKFKGKILYVDKENKNFPYINIDHYKPFYKVISHMIEKHGYQRFAFLNGGKYHSHSKQREQAFRDCMKAHHLSVDENLIAYGDYWYYSGNDFAKKILESDTLPEAIVCANDYMAIGVAEELTANGIRIPEDIAIAGYDSVEFGQTSPQPITSVPIPGKSFGCYAATCIDCLINEKELPDFISDEPLFIGSSCGCHCESLKPKLSVRDQWSTHNTSHNYFRSYSQLTEDLILQTSFEGLMDATQTYTYQIREFESFNICLNDVWQKASQDIHLTEIQDCFTDNMMMLLHCGPSGKGADRLDFQQTFPVSLMLPELYEESDHPRAFLFTSLFFDNISFGYACISYGSEPKAYGETYKMWLKCFMTSLECLRRNMIMRQAKIVAREEIITDSLTGMFNYAGFTKHAKPMIERGKTSDLFHSILAIDLSGLDKINTSFGRKEGDHAIYELSQIILESADEGAMCCRLGNDEFILAELTEDASQSVIHEISRRIDEKIEKRNNMPGVKYPIKIYTGKATGKLQDFSQMEDLVNAAVSNKNGNKTSEQRMRLTIQLTEEEQTQVELVKKILDENLFHYFFQPIVDAHDGSIFAYEALMRAKVEPFISPLEILRFATHLDRLHDVEKATFFNVLDQVHSNRSKFDGKKVFINSIPGTKLNPEDSSILMDKLDSLASSVVVELTEQSEADDESLERMKQEYSSLGVEVAVDDYGTGYSNIINLLRYMPQYVKIDRMLLSGIQDNPQKQHFVKDIVIFAHENDFKVLAEGVETKEELETVIKLNVDLIQGYYTARPNPEIIQEINANIQNEIIAYSAG